MIELVNEKLPDKPVDASTVILLRQHQQQLQTLLLCRGNSRTIMNKAWVFPGGKVDATDLENTASIQTQLSTDARDLLCEPTLNNDTACALFAAACRETLEETSVTLKVSDLQTWSRWITPNEPSMMKKRFDARFFVATIPDGQTAVHDGVEATDSRWYSPASALTEYQSNKIVLAPPQIMTLLALTKFTDIDDCLTAANTTPAYTVQPKAINVKSQNRTLVYPGDEEHTETLQQMPGPTRLVWTGEHFEPPGGFDKYIN